MAPSAGPPRPCWLFLATAVAAASLPRGLAVRIGLEEQSPDGPGVANPLAAADGEAAAEPETTADRVQSGPAIVDEEDEPGGGGNQTLAAGVERAGGLVPPAAAARPRPLKAITRKRKAVPMAAQCQEPMLKEQMLILATIIPQPRVVECTRSALRQVSAAAEASVIVLTWQEADRRQKQIEVANRIQATMSHLWPCEDEDVAMETESWPKTEAAAAFFLRRCLPALGILRHTVREATRRLLVAQGVAAGESLLQEVVTSVSEVVPAFRSRMLERAHLVASQTLWNFCAVADEGWHFCLSILEKLDATDSLSLSAAKVAATIYSKRCATIYASGDCSRIEQILEGYCASDGLVAHQSSVLSGEWTGFCEVWSGQLTIPDPLQPIACQDGAVEKHLAAFRASLLAAPDAWKQTDREAIHKLTRCMELLVHRLGVTGKSLVAQAAAFLMPTHLTNGVAASKDWMVTARNFDFTECDALPSLDALPSMVAVVPGLRQTTVVQSEEVNNGGQKRDPGGHAGQEKELGQEQQQQQQKQQHDSHSCRVLLGCVPYLQEVWRLVTPEAYLWSHVNITRRIGAIAQILPDVRRRMYGLGVKMDVSMLRGLCSTSTPDACFAILGNNGAKTKAIEHFALSVLMPEYSARCLDPPPDLIVDCFQLVEVLTSRCQEEPFASLFQKDCELWREHIGSQMHDDFDTVFADVRS